MLIGTKELSVRVKYGQTFKRYVRNKNRMVARTSAYINQPKIRTPNKMFLKPRTGRIDCPAIVQPELLMALPNGWRVK